MVKKRDKKAQVTIFIILAIVIVALGILIYMFYPQISSSLGLGAQSPNAFIQSCLQDKLKESIDILSPQGGSLNPEFYYLYQGEKIKYLCYTAEDYERCIVQEPMLKQSIEAEVKQNITQDVKQCFDQLESNFKAKGYQVSLKREAFAVELLPKRVIALFNYTLALKKGDEIETYKQFSVILNNNLYELVSIANSIVSFETTIGAVETSAYMNYYHDLKVEKKKQSDGTTIYILTDRNTNERFQFASRSVVWPPGYG
ncbi:MAG TPA: hypothetical protein VJ438_06525 [Candidatus Nanoarchaeia archaeon]|nr:hypothetical protein [Candidatus Nanoarchaeia archaeon]